MACAPSEDSDQPVWSESLLSAWRKLWSLSAHWAHSEDTDQTWQMPRLIWVFAGCTVILFVLSCCGSIHYSWAIRDNFHILHTYSLHPVLQDWRNIYDLVLWPWHLSWQAWQSSAGLVFLTHIRLASHFWDLGKQCRPRSDATECGIWSGSTLFASKNFYSK